MSGDRRIHQLNNPGTGNTPTQPTLGFYLALQKPDGSEEAIKLTVQLLKILMAVTKADVGLGSVDNTSDAAKPISTATLAALSNKADLIGGLLNPAQLPAIAITEYLGSTPSEAAMLALVGQKGDWTVRTDLAKVFIITGNNPAQLASWTALVYPTSGSATWGSILGSITDQIDLVNAFAPFSHSHSVAQINNFTAEVNALIEAALVANEFHMSTAYFMGETIADPTPTDIANGFKVGTALNKLAYRPNADYQRIVPYTAHAAANEHIFDLQPYTATYKELEIRIRNVTFSADDQALLAQLSADGVQFDNTLYSYQYGWGGGLSGSLSEFAMKIVENVKGGANVPFKLDLQVDMPTVATREPLLTWIGKGRLSNNFAGMFEGMGYRTSDQPTKMIRLFLLAGTVSFDAAIWGRK